MRPWKRNLLLGILGIGIAWLLTGGVVVHRYWFFSYDSHNKDFKPYVRVDVKRGDGRFGVPYLFYCYNDSLPFGVKVTYVSCTVVEQPTISIEQLTITFADGTEADFTGRFKAGLIPAATEHWYIDDNHQDQKTPCLGSEMVIDDCIPTRTPFTVRIKGQLRSRGVPMEAFDEEFHFTPTYETKVFTTWYWAIVSQA